MAHDMTLLWGSGSPPCWRVMITLEEKNLQGYNQKQMFFEKREHKSPEVMAMNPRGQLPAFKHGDRILNESYAAMMYLEDQFKEQGNRLIPECPAEIAMMYQRMMEGFTLNQKLMDVHFFHYKFPEGLGIESAVRRVKDILVAELKLWEGYVEKAGGCYVAGKSFSLADAAIFPIFAYIFHYCNHCRERFPNLAAYHDCLKDRPSIKATWPPSWLDNPKGQELLTNLWG